MQDQNDEMAAILREILKWTRVQAAPSVKKTLETILSKAEHRRLYQALDGKKTQKQLAAQCTISQPRISELVTGWQRAGIVEEPAPGKYTKAFDLRDLGIEVEEPSE